MKDGYMYKGSMQVGAKTVGLCLLGGFTLALLVDALMATAALPPGATFATRVCLIGMLAMADAVVVLYIVGSYRTRLLRQHQDRSRAALEFAHRLALAIEMRDPCTPGHNDRLGQYCQIVAEELGLDPEISENLYYAAPFHDVGKIGVPDSILNKEGPLTDRERDQMERHVELGAKILEDSDDPIVELACSIVSTHHEAWDGSGYPRGLKGEEIPIEGRIAAACDVFDALMSSRPYKEPWPVGKVLEEIHRHKGTRFDPTVVEALERAVHRLIQVARANTQQPVWQTPEKAKKEIPLAGILD